MSDLLFFITSVVAILGANISFNPNRSLGLAWILLFRRMDFVWLLMSNSELLRIKNKQKAPYKKQKTASSYYNYTLNGLMTDLGSIISQTSRLFHNME